MFQKKHLKVRVCVFHKYPHATVLIFFLKKMQRPQRKEILASTQKSKLTQKFSHTITLINEHYKVLHVKHTFVQNNNNYNNNNNNNHNHNNNNKYGLVVTPTY